MIQPIRYSTSPLLAGLLVFSLIALALGCHRETAPPAEVVRPVKTMIVTADEEPRERTFPGRVEASRRVELAFQVPGLLAKLPVKEGQAVKEGELIAQLRQDEFQARLAALEGELDQARAGLQALLMGERPEEQQRREAAVGAAEARLENTRAELERSRRLLQQQVVTQSSFDQTQTSHRVAQEELRAARELRDKGKIGREEDIEAQQAQVRALESRVVEANLQLQDATLYAPYDGVIAQRFVEEGQTVRAKDRIVKFQDVDEIDIAVDVPEGVMAADFGTADILRLTAELSAAPGVKFPVQIREIAQVADPVTQTFRVRAAMQAPPGIQALPGMTATITASYRRASILGDRILVPISAVLERDGGEQVVWTVAADQTVTPRSVRVGGAAGSRIEIVEGLESGDRIAVAGVSMLREGMRVRDLGNALGGGGP